MAKQGVRSGLFFCMLKIQKKGVIVAYRHQGLCDRLNAWAAATYIAQITSRKFQLCWPATVECGALWSDLFSTPVNLVGLKEVLKIPQLFRVIEFSDLNAYKYHQNVLWTTWEGPHEMTGDDRKAIAKTLLPTPEISSRVDEVVTRLGITKEVIGVHVRGTDRKMSDFKAKIQNAMGRMWEILQNNPGQKFFVSSDERLIELGFFKKFPDNVLINDNKYNERVSRAPVAVEEGLVNLLLLSRTTFGQYEEFKHYISGYSVWAELLS